LRIRGVGEFSGRGKLPNITETELKSKLCDICQSFIETDLVEIDDCGSFCCHGATRGFKLSADDGCSLCAIVWDTYMNSKYFKDFETSQYVDRVHFIYIACTSGWAFMVVYPHKDVEGERLDTDGIFARVVPTEVGYLSTLWPKFRQQMPLLTELSPASDCESFSSH
jgi:hypothetical protein